MHLGLSGLGIVLEQSAHGVDVPKLDRNQQAGNSALREEEEMAVSGVAGG